MLNTDIAYAAGFFDGEGCISIAKNGGIEIRIINTGFSTLKKLQEIFGGSITERTQRVNKKQYAYSFYGEDGIAFLNTIKPYLIEKLSQVETILEYYELRQGMKALHVPGVRGSVANPDRAILVQVFREILTEQKLMETE